MERTFSGTSLLRTAGRVFVLASLAGTVACGGCGDDPTGNNNNTTPTNNNNTTETNNNSTSNNSNNNTPMEGAITVSPTMLSINENGGTGTFNVSLDVEPEGQVTIDLVSGDESEATVSPAQITFTAANYGTAQTVTVTGVDDSDLDGTQSITIATNVTGTGNYVGVDAADVMVDVLDDDAADGSVQPTGITVFEGGAGATFSVTLSAMPSGTVTIPISVSDATEITTDVTELTFDATNFGTPQMVQVDAIDDTEVEPGQTLSVVVGAATGGGYDGVDLDDVTVTVVDNDFPTVTVTPSVIQTSESGSTATFDVSIGTAPTDDVVITATSTDTTEGSVSGPVTLNAGSMTGTFTVTGLADGVVDGPQTYTITLAAASNDTAYDGISIPAVAVTNLDIDSASVAVTPTVLSVSEAGPTTANFTVALSSDPGETVTIDLVVSDTTEATISTNQLTFDSGNFGTPQTVTVTAIDDTVVDGTTVIQIQTTINATMAYATVPVDDVTVSVLDNDSAAVQVTPTTGLQTSEDGGTDTFTVVLTGQPSANVVIDLTSSDTGEGTVSPTSLTFTSANYSTAQTVTVTGVDDLQDDGNQSYTIVTGITTTDTAYSTVNVPDVQVTNQDDDVAGFTVTNLTGLRTSEGGGTATFTVVLNTPPTDDVVIPIQSTDTTEGTVSPMSLTFTSGDWSTPQMVTVTGVDDSLTDGPVVYTVVLDSTSSADGAYNLLDPPNVIVTNDDNEAGFTVTPLSLTISESGANATATFGITLNSPPAQNVRIDLTPDGLEGNEYNVSPQQFVFTPTNWLTAQTATVTGVPDTTIDGPQTWGIDVGIGSTVDPAYMNNCLVGMVQTCPPQTVQGTTTDSDSIGVLVQDTEFSLTEGDCRTVTVLLNTNAVSDLTFTASLADTMAVANNQLRFNSPSSTLTTINRTITAGTTSATFDVCGFDDIIAENQKQEGIVIGPFTAAGGASDPYDAIDPADLTVTINDDDTPAITVTFENGAGVGDNQNLVTGEAFTNTIFDEIYISLATPPTTSVIVTMATTAPDEAILSDNISNTGPSIAFVFQPSNWSTPQTVRAIGVDDMLLDGTQPFQLTFTVTSADAFYDGLVRSPISGLNIDDDLPGWSTIPLTFPLETSETGSPDAQYLIAMNNAPTSPVAVNVVLNSPSSPADEARFISCAGASCTINTPQTISMTYPVSSAGPYCRFRVEGLQDSLVDGPKPWVVSPTSLVTTDPFYVTTTYPTVNGVNNDDDSIGFVVSGLASDIDEDGSDNFTVRLASQPTADVIVTVGTSDAGEGTISSGANLVFTTTSWNGPQAVTISGVEDNTIDGNQDIFVTLSSTSADTAYNNQTDQQPITINDIDSGYIDIDTGGAIVTNESGTTHIIRVRLSSMPTGNVTVPVYSFDTTEATVAPASLTFTPGNWSTFQNVTVTGVDDLVQDGNQNFEIVFDIPTSSDPAFNGLPPQSFTGTNNDDDKRGITIIQPSDPPFLVTDENGMADTFQVVLNTAPAAGKVVVVEFGSASGCVANTRCVRVWPTGGVTQTRAYVSGALTFTPANWNIPQTVTVTGENNTSTSPVQWFYVDGAIDELATDADPAYTNASIFIEQVLGANVDNDEEAIVALSTALGNAGGAGALDINQALITGENGRIGTVYVRGTDLPSANVDLAFAVSGGQASVPGNFTLTQSNYRTLNPIGFTGQDDGVNAQAIGYTAFDLDITATSGDPNYDGETAFVQGYNVDNDQCRLLLLPTTTAGSRLNGASTPPVLVPYVALIGANPPTTAVQTAVSYMDDVLNNATTLTFSNGAQPSTLNAYAVDGALDTFSILFGVTLGDSCYTTSADQLLLGRGNP